MGQCEGLTMNWAERISVQADLMAGEPCVKGTRIPVSLIVGSMADGDKVEDLLKAFPQLTAEDIQACLQYAYECLKVTTVRPWAV